MGWIQDYRRQSSQDSHQQQDTESQFASAARSRWRELGDELRADVAEFNKQGTGAELAVEGEDTYRVRNSGSGLELVLKLTLIIIRLAMTMRPSTSAAPASLRAACFP